jgi:DamX protein
MLQAAGRLPVIVVDDAHLLPVATLIALFRLFERRPGSRALIRVVLFATPEITGQFQTPQLQAMNLQSLQSLEMPLFDKAQAQAFIRFLLDAEKGQQELQIASGRIERIIRESAGLPGVLEAQLQTVFTLSPKHQAKIPPEPAAATPGAARTILADLPKSVLVGAPLLALLLLLTLVFQDEINGLFDQSNTERVAEHPKTLAGGGLHPLKLPEPDSSLLRDDKAPPVVENLQEQMPAVADTPIGNLALPEIGMRTLDEPQPVQAPSGDVEMAGPTPAEVPQPLPADGMPLAAEPGPADVQPVDVEDVPADPTPKGDAEKVTAVIPEEVQATAAESTDTPVTRPDTPVVAVRPADKKGILDQKWILTQKPSAYTLQLVAVRDEAAIKRFIQKHQLSGDIAYFKTNRSGQAWYSVIYGVYPDRSAAIQGRETLPPALRKSDVWPRTYASIQEAVAR